MNIKAKFQLQEYRRFEYGGDYTSHTFIFRPQYAPDLPEDQRFHKATPHGELSITVDNPPVVEYWQSMLGKQFYLDFTPVDTDAA